MTESKQQRRVNHRLIWFGWILAITHTFGMAACVFLWTLDMLETAVTDQITNVLSWEASVLTALGLLITAYTKRDVNN